MITVENDYEPNIYEQPFSSHTYENQLELLNNYYMGTTNNNLQITQELNEKKTVIKPSRNNENNAQLIISLKTFKNNNHEKKFGQSHFF